MGDSTTRYDVLSFAFMPPHTDSAHEMVEMADYFDLRTGKTWDLFLPGYVRVTDHHKARELRGAMRPVSGFGEPWGPHWFWTPEGFDAIRRAVEHRAEGRWSYEGCAQLVLVNTVLRRNETPIIDWPSIQYGSLNPARHGTSSLSVGEVIERITQDLEWGIEDGSYGVGSVVGVEPSDTGWLNTAREFLVNFTAGVLANLAAR
jgi:hypothetical protein